MTPHIIVSVLDSLAAPNDRVMTQALSLAGRYGARLHVAYVGPSTGSDARGGDEIRDELVRHIARASDRSGARDVDITPIVLTGDPVQALASYADQVSPDLVVVGTHTRRGGFLSGSLAPAIGKTIEAPTLTVPGDLLTAADRSGRFRNIVVPIDFSDVSLLALSEALGLALQNGGRLLLLHVLDDLPYEPAHAGAGALHLMSDLPARVAKVNRELRALVPREAFDWSEIDAVTVTGIAHDAIVATAGAWRADLIVLGLPRRSRLGEFVAGSTARKVLRHATSPVLLVPGPATANAARRVRDNEIDVAAPDLVAWATADSPASIDRRAS